MLIGPYADPNQVEAEAWAELRQRCAHLDRTKLTPVRRFVPKDAPSILCYYGAWPILVMIFWPPLSL
jgi:hypothetical protein